MYIVLFLLIKICDSSIVESNILNKCNTSQIHHSISFYRKDSLKIARNFQAYDYSVIRCLDRNDIKKVKQLIRKYESFSCFKEYTISKIVLDSANCVGLLSVNKYRGRNTYSIPILKYENEIIMNYSNNDSIEIKRYLFQFNEKFENQFDTEELKKINDYFISGITPTYCVDYY